MFAYNIKAYMSLVFCQLNSSSIVSSTLPEMEATSEKWQEEEKKNKTGQNWNTIIEKTENKM